MSENDFGTVLWAVVIGGAVCAILIGLALWSLLS
jgi:hypothetical protein